MRGGGVYAANDALVEVKDIPHIKNNKAAQGGFLYVYNAEAEFKNDISFSENQVTESTLYNTMFVNLGGEFGNYGGAIANNTGSLTFSGNTVFENNSAGIITKTGVNMGGALFINDGKAVFKRGAEFKSNVATGNTSYSYVYGGAISIYATRNEGASSLIFEDPDARIVFEGNHIASSADGFGGAITAHYLSVIVFKGESLFKENHTSNAFILARGGAIYTHGGALANNKLSFEKLAVFEGNYVNNDGGYHGVAGNGGAITLDLTNVDFNGGVIFTGNYVKPLSRPSALTSTNSNGGAIFGDKMKMTVNGVFTLKDNAVESYNTNQKSGGMYVGGNSEVTIISPGLVEISGNTSKSTRYADYPAGMGGGIYVNSYGILDITAPSILFENNTAAAGGSVAVSARGTVIFSVTPTFSGNTVAGAQCPGIWSNYDVYTGSVKWTKSGYNCAIPPP